MAIFVPTSEQQLLDIGLKQRGLYFRGNGYGFVFTKISPNNLQVRLEMIAMHDQAQLIADVLCIDQPHLPHRVELAKWLIRRGCRSWQQERFMSAVARSIIWQPAEGVFL